MLRLIVTRGPAEGGPPTAYALLAPIGERQLAERRDGVSAITLSRGMTADATVEAPWLLGGVKAISYAVNMAALRYARASGADEVIFTSADGQLLEAPTATVVWLAGRVLRTPPPAPLGILDGVTVRHLFRAAAAAGFGTEIQPRHGRRPARRGRRLAAVEHPDRGRRARPGRQAAGHRPGDHRADPGCRGRPAR